MRHRQAWRSGALSGYCTQSRGSGKVYGYHADGLAMIELSVDLRLSFVSLILIYANLISGSIGTFVGLAK